LTKQVIANKLVVLLGENMKKFWNEFKKFISRGNVVDMAVGVIIASAFTAIVTSLTNKIIMPLVNWLLAIITGGNGLDAIYTFLKKAYTTDGAIDLANSIYIDWGSLITAVIDFFLIAFILFCILKAFNSMEEGFKKVRSDFPTRQERKELKEKGVNFKDTKLLLEETAKLRAEKEQQAKDKKALEDAKQREENPTQEDLLKEIRDLLKQNAKDENKETETK
jgi:large conductance mechanosensitive channel